MAVEIPALGQHQAIVNLPVFDLTELLPVCEMLCQEGFTTWSLPVERVDELAALKAQFARRARIGVASVTTVAHVRAAAEAGAAFVAADFLLPKLVKAVSGLPVILGGTTPTELRLGLDAGAAAVQVLPAEVFGSDYARALPALLGYPPLIASGRMSRGLAALWLESGAIGVWPPELFGDDAVIATSLDDLRAALHLWQLAD